MQEARTDFFSPILHHGIAISKTHSAVAALPALNLEADLDAPFSADLLKPALELISVHLLGYHT
jgi:hypothetical protein